MIVLAAGVMWNVYAGLDLRRENGSLVIKSEKLAFTLADEKNGMGMLSIKSTTNVEFMKRGVSPAEAKLWRVKMTPDVKDKAAFVTINNLSECRERRVFRQEDKIILCWNGVSVASEKNAADVHVEIGTDPETGMPDWRLKVTNRSRKYGIWQAYLPELELGVIGDGNGSDDYLLMSPAEGRSVRNPIYWSEQVKEEKIEFDLTTNATASLKNDQNSNGFGFGAQEPYGLPYPSARGQMQLNAYYRKEGNFYYPSRTPMPGLYLAAHDPKGSPKVFYASDEPRNHLLRFVVGHYPEASCRPGTDYIQDYPMLIGFFNGDWYDAAAIYRQWASRQYWLNKGKLYERRDVPEWFLRMTAWIRLTNDRGMTLASCRRYAAMYRDLLSGTLGIQWYGWERGLILSGCGEFPTTSSGVEGLEETIASIQAKDTYVFPYVNTRVWCKYENDKSWGTRNFDKAAGELQIKPDGSPDGALRKVKTDNITFFKVCPHSRYWGDYLTAICSQIVDRYDVRGIYLDEGANLSFGGGAYDVQGCFSEQHPHTPGVTLELLAAERRRFQQIIDMLTARGKQGVLTGEGNSEIFIDIFASKLIHYEIWPGHVPLFSAVYHEYSASYGRTITAKSRVPGDPISAMQTGWQLITGSQLARLWPANFKDDEVQKNLSYAAEGTRLRNGPGYKFLCIGKMLRPPFVSTTPEVVTGQFSRINHICKLPAVLAASWEAPDGDVAVVLTNISEESVEFELEVTPSEYGFKGEIHYEKIFPDEKYLGTGPKLPLRMAPREIALIKVSGDRLEAQAQKAELVKDPFIGPRISNR